MRGNSTLLLAGIFVVAAAGIWSGCDSGGKKSSLSGKPPARIGRGATGGVSVQTDSVSLQYGVSGYSGVDDYCTGSNPGPDLLACERNGSGSIFERIYIRFDLGGGEVPFGATVVSASITLTVYRESGCYGSASDVLEIRPLTQAWTGSGDLSYITPPAPPAGSSVIPDYPSSGSTPNVLPVPEPLEVSIDPSVVQGWVDGAGNNGVTVIPSEALDVFDLQFFSSEATTASYRPKLTITYTMDSNQPPTCSVSASPTSGSAPLEVNFTGTASDSDGTIRYYAYDFDDGELAYTKDATHTFEHPGTYFINFSVQDDCGKCATDIVTVTVSDPAPPPDYISIDYHPYRFPLEPSSESCAPGMRRPLPSSRKHTLVWHDQMDSCTPAQVAFVARNMIGSQKLMQLNIEPFRQRNPDFHVLQYHLAYGLTRGSDWVDKNTWGAEKDKFDAWMASRGYGSSVMQNVFIVSSLSTFQSSSDNPDWDVEYGIPGMLDGGLRNGDDFYYMNPGYAPSGNGRLWERYIAEETVRRMQMNDDGYNCDGTFFDTSHEPGPGLVNCPSNWYTGVSGTNSNLYAATQEDFNDVWNTEAGGYYHYVRTAYSSGHRYLVLPNSNNMISVWYEPEYLENTDGAFIEHFCVSGGGTLLDAGPGEWERSFTRICKYITGPKKVLCALPSFDYTQMTVDERRFIMASFLLVKDDTSYIAYNCTGLGTSPTSSANPRWFPEFEIDIGGYLDDCPTDLADLRVENTSNLYIRWYSGGLVLLNTSDSLTYDFELDRSYYPINFSGGGWVGSNGVKAAQSLSTASAVSGTVQLGPGEALILRAAPIN